ncbi:hypothetical protein [Labilibaculum euxinus]|uniref:Uncharacterized protein n=1 Tax=Labilibaculum euxinus TaxID=2686357 RepID=A0A7M4D2F4_9BACT|nr:hypothetical protein [Labilibaculum euxinus]MUP36833.1 hypothetical protein [Labilibaculum euxinus]MVB06038.1 hypothetical protein [Labilibaculum euxinus]
MRKLFLIFGIAGILLSSCTNDDAFNEDANDLLKNNEEISVLNANDKEKYLVNFACALSKATYERKDIREFLKTESLKQFDKNYDALYYLIKDELINGKSFRDILISYSSKEIIEEIEINVPLLNILVPNIMFFDIKPENLNTEDQEIPVVVSKLSETSLFMNGEKELSLQKGEVPNFHVFVVNENIRVVAPVSTKGGLKSAGSKSVVFKSPNYDGRSKNQEESTTKSVLVSRGDVGSKAIEAYEHFNKDDGSIYQKAFQRDFIYYGLTPENQTGSLNRSVSEYISFIEVEPNAYFNITDDNMGSISSGDPYIENNSVTQKKRELSEAELLDRMWTVGAYNFKFEIISSSSSIAIVKYIAARPDQLWNFNIKHSYKHSTTFGHHSKNTYVISVEDFTSKRMHLDSKYISFGKWNLSEEALTRFVNITEEDGKYVETTTITQDFSHVRASNFKGDTKLSLGLGKLLSGSVDNSVSITDTNTEKSSKSVSVVRTEGPDYLGNAKIYYYDPIIDERRHSTWLRPEKFSLHTYNAGKITFGISVK